MSFSNGCDFFGVKLLSTRLLESMLWVGKFNGFNFNPSFCASFRGSLRESKWGSKFGPLRVFGPQKWGIARVREAGRVQPSFASMAIALETAAWVRFRSSRGTSWSSISRAAPSVLDFGLRVLRPFLGSKYRITLAPSFKLSGLLMSLMSFVRSLVRRAVDGRPLGRGKRFGSQKSILDWILMTSHSLSTENYSNHKNSLHAVDLLLKSRASGKLKLGFTI